MKSNRFEKLPRHIAFIMDGNRRWAKRRGLSTKIGHAQGVKALEKMLKEIYALGIEYVSVFAYSTENWSRSEDEVNSLMDLFRVYFKTHFKKLAESGIKVNVLGDMSAFPDDLQSAVDEVISCDIPNVVGTLNIAMNYGAQSEIVRAVNLAVEKGEMVTKESFSSLLYTAGMPDPDLVVRTGGEIRLSNFLLYQSAYAELYFCKKMWPDFNKRQLYKALKAYAGRNIRHGK